MINDFFIWCGLEDLGPKSRAIILGLIVAFSGTALIIIALRESHTTPDIVTQRIEAIENTSLSQQDRADLIKAVLAVGTNQPVHQVEAR